jgi:PAS domain S-box-containing protein
MRVKSGFALAFLAVCLASAGPLTTVRQVAGLNNSQARNAYPVDLNGVVTYSDPEWGLLFVQDGTGAIYVDVHGQGLKLAPGTRISVHAVTGPGDVGPVLVRPTPRVLGRGELPAPEVLSLAALDGGSADSHWVETRGVLRPGNQSWDRICFRIVDGKTWALVVIPQPDKGESQRWIGARVKVRGVCGSRLGSFGKREGAQLFVSGLENIYLEERPAGATFAVPITPLGTLRSSAADQRFVTPVRVRATMTWDKPGVFFVEDGTGAASVWASHDAGIHVGDTVDVTGFPAHGDYGIGLADASVRLASPPAGASRISPQTQTASDLFAKGLSGRLVRLRAHLVEQTENATEHVLLLEDGGRRFDATLTKTSSGQRVFNLARDSVLEVTGVEVIRAGSPDTPPSLLLLIRSPGDLVLLGADVWPVLRNALGIVAVMGAAVLGTLFWIGLLRRTVRRQTETIRVRLEREAQLESEYRRLFERNLAGVFRWRPDGTILDCNHALARMLGFRSREELIGRSYWDFETDEAERMRLRGTLAGDAVSNRDVCLRLEQGGEVWLLENISPVQTAEGTVWETTAIDVTELKRYQEELRKARDAAEAASRYKSEFLANMSHEIRTPMNGILGMTELALGTSLNAEQREYLEGVRNSADLLLRVINDILDFSKIEVGKLQLESVAFDLRDCVGRALRALSVEAHRKRLEIACTFSREVPSRVVGDPVRFVQVLNNLVSNAIKFTEHGEVVVDVAVRARETERVELVVSVRDTGLGIAREKQRLIFESFAQADTSTTRRFGGTGLGLAISSTLVRLMGGEIRVESEPGVGSTFLFGIRFGLPAAGDAAEDAPDARYTGRKALVVDDSMSARRSLRQALEGFGMTVSTVGNGAEAMAALRSCGSGVECSLYLVDAEMPGMDGVQLGEALRHRGVPGARIVLLTIGGSGGAEELRHRGLIAGCLAKPVQHNELRAMLERVFAEHQPEPPPVNGAGEAAPAWSGAEKTNPSVLLAEDNPMNRKLATRMLEKLGCSVHVADNGREAVEEWKRGVYDAVFMDVQMPEIDGFEATRLIREAENRAVNDRRTPIVAMTAHALADDRERCLSAGMNVYMSKPISLAALSAALTEVLSLRGGPARADGFDGESCAEEATNDAP